MLEMFVDTEYQELKDKYNPDASIKKVNLEFVNEKFFNDFKKTINTDRRGEVGFLLKRKNGKYVVVRSRKYPKYVYRIPTGGIRFSENAIDALYREIKEELGVEIKVETFKGIIEYEIRYKEDVIKFYSYVFGVTELSGNLIEDATENEITDYKEVELCELKEMAQRLINVEGAWKDWCGFRSELIQFYLGGEKL